MNRQRKIFSEAGWFFLGMAFGVTVWMASCGGWTPCYP